MCPWSPCRQARVSISRKSQGNNSVPNLAALDDVRLNELRAIVLRRLYAIRIRRNCRRAALKSSRKRCKGIDCVVEGNYWFAGKYPFHPRKHRLQQSDHFELRQVHSDAHMDSASE